MAYRKNHKAAHLMQNFEERLKKWLTGLRQITEPGEYFGEMAAKE